MEEILYQIPHVPLRTHHTRYVKLSENDGRYIRNKNSAFSPVRGGGTGKVRVLRRGKARKKWKFRGLDSGTAVVARSRTRRPPVSSLSLSPAVV